MSERLISQLQSFLDRIKNDTRSALMFEADADTLREAMARIKADGMKVDHMMNEADKDVIRIAQLQRDLAAAQAERDDARIELEHDHEICNRLERERDEARAEAAALRVRIEELERPQPNGQARKEGV